MDSVSKVFDISYKKITNKAEDSNKITTIIVCLPVHHALDCSRPCQPCFLTTTLLSTTKILQLHSQLSNIGVKLGVDEIGVQHIRALKSSTA